MNQRDAFEAIANHADRFRDTFKASFLQAPPASIERRFQIAETGRETIKEVGSMLALMVMPLTAPGMSEEDTIIGVRGLLEFLYVTGYEAAERDMQSARD